MRILLRDPQRGFYAGPGQWTGDHSQAAAFENTNKAIDQVCEGRLSGMEVVMHFENPEFEIPLSIAGLGEAREEAPFNATR